ncbi:MAG: hypothetical protein LBB89_09785 [Treponema sp.]|jgi:hypothetical protein|nr:hypothetical protein [Treponema sp.]
MNYDLIQTITGIVGLVAIGLLAWQIKINSKWEKIKFSIDRIDRSFLQKNLKIISELGIEFNDDMMSDDEYNKIINEENSGTLNRIQDILDMLERFSAVYNMKILNKHFAYNSYSESIIFYYSKFKRIINFYQNKYDPFYYENLEKCANSFLKLKQNKLKSVDKDIKKFNKFKQKTAKKLEKFQAYIKDNSISINSP